MIIGSHGLTQEGGGRRGGSPKAEARKRDKAPHEVNTRYPREITVGGHTNDVQLLRYDVTWFALHEVQAFRSVTKLIGKRSGRLPRARECVKSSKLLVLRHPPTQTRPPGEIMRGVEHDESIECQRGEFKADKVGKDGRRSTSNREMAKAKVSGCTLSQSDSKTIGLPR